MNKKILFLILGLIVLSIGMVSADDSNCQTDTGTNAYCNATNVCSSLGRCSWDSDCGDYLCDTTTNYCYDSCTDDSNCQTSTGVNAYCNATNVCSSLGRCSWDSDCGDYLCNTTTNFCYDSCTDDSNCQTDTGTNAYCNATNVCSSLGRCSYDSDCGDYLCDTTTNFCFDSCVYESTETDELDIDVVVESECDTPRDCVDLYDPRYRYVCDEGECLQRGLLGKRPPRSTSSGSGMGAAENEGFFSKLWEKLFWGRSDSNLETYAVESG